MNSGYFCSSGTKKRNVRFGEGGRLDFTMEYHDWV
jgi:hypothetical protein